MVRPASFGFNSETAANNYFQKAEAQSNDTAVRARREFDDYVDLLRRNGVDVWVIQDTPQPYTPIQFFPIIGLVPISQASLFSIPCLLPTGRRRENYPLLPRWGCWRG